MVTCALGNGKWDVITVNVKDVAKIDNKMTRDTKRAINVYGPGSFLFEPFSKCIKLYDDAKCLFNGALDFKADWVADLATFCTLPVAEQIPYVEVQANLYIHGGLSQRLKNNSSATNPNNPQGYIALKISFCKEYVDRCMSMLQNISLICFVVACMVLSNLVMFGCMFTGFMELLDGHSSLVCRR
jgi:hypothetical protein